MRSLCTFFGVSSLLVLVAGCGSSYQAAQTLKPAPQPNSVASVSLSGTSFDFGETLVGNPLQKSVVTVTNTGDLPVTMNPALAGDASYSILAAQSCGTQLAAGASCSMQVQYAPTTGSAPVQQTAAINLNFGNVAAGTPSTVSLTGTSAVMAVGTVTATANPQVALYTITPPFAGNVTVSFGITQNYGLNTWSVPTPSGGGPVQIEVAGMLANTQYHIRATVAFQNGISANDIDHTFTTGNVLPAAIAAMPGQKLPQISAITTAGMTPQSGIEMVDPIVGEPSIVATDLQGNIIWTYDPPDPLNGATLYVPKQLANGDYIAIASVTSSTVATNPPPVGAASWVREFDLAGNTIKQITMAQLNAKLAAANYNITLLTFHHDVTVLPNGHWLVLANTRKSVVLNGATTPTNVLGDVIVDLDTNLNVAWVWNEFDHLNVNRHPEGLPDWTHTNAVIYSKDDGDLLVSSRHQSWLMKIDYENGTGDGHIIWRLGYQGDFKLIGGTDPTDWFYGQHGPSFTTPNTSGIFGLTFFDNGNFRVFAPGVNCGTSGAPPCQYSTVPIFQINESAMTATLEFHQKLPANLYAFFGGNAEMLPNGDEEYDLCGLGGPPHSQIFEVTAQGTPQTVWNLQLSSNYAYRGYRLPSLYPGVQW